MNRIKTIFNFFKKCGLICFVFYISYRLLEKLLLGIENLNQKIYILLQNRMLLRGEKNSELQRNRMLINTCQNKDALLVATGESARLIVGKNNIQDKVIITVNEGFLFLVKLKITPDFLIINDESYFDSNRRLSVVKTLFKIMPNNKLKAFFPLQYRNLIISDVEKNNLQSQVFFYDTYPSKLSVLKILKHAKFDFELPFPSLPTVTHIALFLSIYLGCKKTELLGVDLDYILDPLKPIRHCYDNEEEFESGNLSCLEEYKKNMGWGFEELLKRTQEQLAYFRLVKEFGLKKNHQFRNLSKSSKLDEFVFDLIEQ